MRIRIISCGVKYTPADAKPILAQVEFNARVLKNPYYDERLRPFYGTDPRIADWIKLQPGTKEFLFDVNQKLAYQFQLMIEGKLTDGELAVLCVCTGGKHRSVFLAEQCKEIVTRLAAEAHVPVAVTVMHRDLGKE